MPWWNKNIVAVGHRNVVLCVVCTLCLNPYTTDEIDEIENEFM